MSKQRDIEIAMAKKQQRELMTHIQKGLSLPGKITKVSWQLPKEMTFKQWVAAGRALCGIERAVQWWIGDWWAYGEHAYGERIKAMREGVFGVYTFQVLMNLGWVAKAFKTSLRSEVLSFGHHRIIAPYVATTRVAERWIKRAIDNEWSVNELKSAIARSNAVGRTREVKLEADKVGKFAVLYVDPPWQYEHPPIGASNRSVENHFPTETIDDICAIPVGDIAHEDSILYLWVTNPKLEESFRVINAWRFQYRTNFAWIKDKIGTGYHNREQHELLLVAKRGELPPPPPECRIGSVLEYPRGEHSAKPPQVRDLLDRMYPGLKKIELFARNIPDHEKLTHLDWTFWGNDARLPD